MAFDRRDDLIEALKENPARMIVAECDLANTNSKTFCRVLRKSTEREIPILLVPESATIDQVRLFLSNGANDVILSGSGPGEINKRVSLWITKTASIISTGKAVDWPEPEGAPLQLTYHGETISAASPASRRTQLDQIETKNAENRQASNQASKINSDDGRSPEEPDTVSAPNGVTASQNGSAGAASKPLKEKTAQKGGTSMNALQTGKAIVEMVKRVVSEAQAESNGSAFDQRYILGYVVGAVEWWGADFPNVKKESFVHVTQILEEATPIDAVEIAELLMDWGPLSSHPVYMTGFSDGQADTSAILEAAEKGQDLAKIELSANVAKAEATA